MLNLLALSLLFSWHLWNSYPYSRKFNFRGRINLKLPPGKKSCHSIASFTLLYHQKFMRLQEQGEKECIFKHVTDQTAYTALYIFGNFLHTFSHLIWHAYLALICYSVKLMYDSIGLEAMSDPLWNQGFSYWVLGFEGAGLMQWLEATSGINSFELPCLRISHIFWGILPTL